MTDETGDNDAPTPRLATSAAPAENVVPIPNGAQSLEAEMGRIFAATQNTRLLFNHTTGKWMHWDDSRWRIDTTKTHLNLMRIYTDRERQQDARRTKLSSLSFNRNCLEFASAHEGMARTREDFDQDPMLLGTPTGYVDLATGKHYRPDPSKMISKATGVTPMGTANCPQWMKFIKWAFHDDEDTIRYMQKFFGYCLTGKMNEEIMTFIHGPGGNGKGVMIRTIGMILGEYATSAASSTFMAQKYAGHPTEIADLDGPRFVTSSETAEDDKWDMARIKEITGNERPLRARFMRQDFFEFDPVCKLLIVGNNKPAIDQVDEAITRRLRLVEMKRKPSAPDDKLKDLMQKEMPGILRWMIEGCLLWQKEGLKPTEAISKASRKYLSAQNVVAQFIDEVLDFRPTGILLKRDIGWALGVWLRMNGLPSKGVKDRQVYRRLEEDHGLDGDAWPDPANRTRGFHGVNIKPEFWDILRLNPTDKPRQVAASLAKGVQAPIEMPDIQSQIDEEDAARRALEDDDERAVRITQAALEREKWAEDYAAGRRRSREEIDEENEGPF